MTQAAKRNLTQALFFNSIARQFFESAAHESTHNDRNVMNAYATKCKVIEDHVMTYQRNDKALAHFRRELKQGDTMLFGNIFDILLCMDAGQRETVELLITAIKNGEVLEIREAASYG